MNICVYIYTYRNFRYLQFHIKIPCLKGRAVYGFLDLFTDFALAKFTSGNSVFHQENHVF